MPKPPTFSEAEIAALSETIAQTWRRGSQFRPWLRRNSDRLYQLKTDGDWSWAAIAAAMSMAGITYRTGKPLTARVLMNDLWLAARPLKGRRRAAAVAAPQAEAPVQAGLSRPLPGAAQALPAAPPPIPAVSSPPASQFPAPVNAPPPDQSVGVTRKQYVFEAVTSKPAPQSIEEALARDEPLARFRQSKG